MTVLKRNGNREIFNRNKLLNGLNRACEKTSIENNKIEVIVDELELQIQQRNIREIDSSEIGEIVLDHLRGINEVAYIRFASVYRQFHGINDFVKTLETFEPKKGQLATVL